jgi:hypothetical protein
VAIAVPAFASDGVLEVNQTCALGTGRFPSDGPVFPVTISQSGSYVLTSNLDVTGQPSPENVTAIDANAGYVNIDLNGFSITGPGTAGSGMGIDAASSTIQGNSCHNNTKSGINGDNGNNGSSIVGNAVNFNTADGIEVRFGSLLRGNAIRNNGGFGMNNTAGISGYTENVFDSSSGSLHRKDQAAVGQLALPLVAHSAVTLENESPGRGHLAPAEA